MQLKWYQNTEDKIFSALHSLLVWTVIIALDMLAYGTRKTKAWIICPSKVSRIKLCFGYKTNLEEHVKLLSRVDPRGRISYQKRMAKEVDRLSDLGVYEVDACTGMTVLEWVLPNNWEWSNTSRERGYIFFSPFGKGKCNTKHFGTIILQCFANFLAYDAPHTSFTMPTMPRCSWQRIQKACMKLIYLDVGIPVLISSGASASSNFSICNCRPL